MHHAKLVELTVAEYLTVLAGTATDELKSRIHPDDNGGGIIIIVRP